MKQREFVEQYVLNAARGAGQMRLNVDGAITEAMNAWKAMETRILPEKVKDKSGYV